MAGNEEILFNVTGDVQQAISALNDWASSIDNVAKGFNNLESAMNGLDGQISSLSDSIKALADGFKLLMDSAGAVGDLFNNAGQASDALAQAQDNLAQTTDTVQQGLQAVAETLTTVEEASSATDEALSAIGDTVDAMGQQLATAAQDLSLLGDDGNTASDALARLDEALNTAFSTISSADSSLTNFDQAMTGLLGPIDAADQAIAALGTNISDTATTAFVTFLDQFNQLQAQVSTFQQISQQAADGADKLATATLDAGSASSTAATQHEANAAAQQTLADMSGQVTQQTMFATSAVQALNAVLVENDASVQTANTAMANISNATFSFGDAIDGLIAKLNQLDAALASMAGEEEAAAGAEKDAEGAGGGDAYMLMMLIPMITQAAGGFLQMGMAAEDSIAKITGLADQSLQGAAGLSRLNSVINQLSTDSMQFGVSLKDAADGMYFIISEGFNSADALKVLNVSMEASAATGTKMQTVSTALTSVMNAYGISADKAKQTQDQLTAAVVSGAQQYDTFANAIGKTAAQGRAAGFSLQEVLAAEAAMTKVNPSVRQDTANLGNLMSVLHNGMDKTAKAAAALGLKFSEQKYASLDLTERLQYLLQATHGNWTEMRALLQNATATNAAFYILANGGKNVAETLKAQTDAAGSLDKAFQSTSQTISFALGRITGALSVMAYNVVAAVGPTVSGLFSKFADLLSTVAGNAQILMPVIATVATMMGVVLVGAIAAVVGMFWEALAPIGAIALALGAVIGVVVAVAMHMRDLAAAGSPIGFVLHNMAVMISNAFNQLKNAVGGALTALHPLLQGLGTIVDTVVIPAFAYFMNGVGMTFAQIIQQIAAAIRSATPSILAFGNYVRTSIAPALQAALPQIEMFAFQLGQWAPKILPIIVGLLGFRGAIGALQGVIGGVRTGLMALDIGFSTVQIAVSEVMIAWNNFLMFLPRIGPLLGVAGTAIKDLAGALVGNLGSAFSWLMGIGPRVIAFFASFGSPLEALWAIFQSVGAAVGGFVVDLVALINPVTLVAAAVIALGAILVVWLTTTKQGQAVLAGIWAAVVSLGAVLMNALRPAWAAIQQAMATVAPLFGQLWQEIQPFIPVVMQVAQLLGGLLLVALAAVVAAIVGVIAALANFIAGLINVIAHVIQFAVGIIQVFVGAFTFLKGLIHGNGAEMQQGWNTICQGIENIWNGFWGAIKAVAMTFINTIKGLVGGFVDSISSMFHAMADAVVHHSIWPDMWSAIHANTATSTAQVHAQVQTFSTQTQATFIQMQTAAASSMAQMWTNVQRTIAVSMQTSTAAVRSGFTQMNTQVVASGNLIRTSVMATWAAVGKDITTSLNQMETTVRSCFATIIVTVTQDDALILTDTVATWTAMNTQTKAALALMQNTITTAYAAIVKTITADLNQITLQDQTFWTSLINNTRTYWTLILTLYTQYELLIYNNYRTWQLQLTVLYTQWWTQYQTFLKAQLLLVTTTWTTFWLALIKLDQTNWKTMVLDATNGMKLINTAIQTGTKTIETTITALIQWITQQMTALDKSATTWGADFGANFAAGVKSKYGAIQSAISGMAGMMKSNLGHSKPSQGVLADDDVWGEHFVQNFATGIERGLPALTMAAQNAAAVIAATVPTASNVVNATRSTNGNVTNGTEHLAVLRQILQQLKQMSNGGTSTVNNIGSTTIGYNIPSTQLGTIQQQFGNSATNGLSPSQIANIYNQMNMLQGLSQEYGMRGATTGVGF
jgi:TP901 family phage tail tape measure protein